MRVGLEDTTLRPIDSDYREHIIRDIHDSQTADIYVGRVLGDRERALAVARYCRDHRISFQVADSCPFDLASEIRRQVGSLFKGYYWSECDGYLWGYASKPHYHRYSVQESERTMRTAYEDCVAYFRRMVDAVQGDRWRTGAVGAAGRRWSTVRRARQAWKSPYRSSIRATTCFWSPTLEGPHARTANRSGEHTRRKAAT